MFANGVVSVDVFETVVVSVVFEAVVISGVVGISSVEVVGGFKVVVIWGLKFGGGEQKSFKTKEIKYNNQDNENDVNNMVK